MNSLEKELASANAAEDMYAAGQALAKLNRNRDLTVLLDNLRVMYKYLDCGQLDLCINSYGFGLCSNIRWLWETVAGQVEELEECHLGLAPFYLNWPKYSGHSSYPIPATNPAYNGDPFTQYMDGDNYAGKQLELRLELLEFMMKEIHPLIITEQSLNEYGLA